MAETVLMASAAIILAAVALVAAAGAFWVVSLVVGEWRRRYRIRGLTAAQIRYIQRMASRFRARNAEEGAP